MNGANHWAWVWRVAFTAGWLGIAAGCAFPTPKPTGRPPIEEPASVIGGDAEALIATGFTAYDPDHQKHMARYGRRLAALATSLARIQATGNDMACSTQIYLEAVWLYRYRADWERLDRQLSRLNTSLNNPDQLFALAQSPEDGRWGICYDEWFMRAEATLGALDELYDEGRLPRHPVELSGRFRTPTELRAYLDELLVSDIGATGRDNRGELGNLTTTLTSSFFKAYLRTYLRQVFGSGRSSQNADLQSSFESMYDDFLHRWQDPMTGYWGAWYRSDGKIYKTADLGITYHTIAYRRGQVDHWPEIIETTLRIKNDPYPYGWLHDGHFANHNNYDVARILLYGWPHMSTSQRRQAAASIKEMLDWTLERSLDPDGSFKTDPTSFSSVSADYYFGVSFLAEIGFWNQGKRFWTNSGFPGAANVCRLIRARMLELKLKDPQARHAL